MFNKICFFICLFILSLNSFAAESQNFSIPCMAEMVGYGNELYTSLNSTSTIEVQLENKIENSPVKDFKMSWKAPKATFSGSTITITVIAKVDSCVLK